MLKKPNESSNTLLILIKNNSFQIISGAYRGRKFRFFDNAKLRPTSGKIRQTLFNWIQFEILNKTCLDLFAGSGALGFEALSRGAAKIVCVERDFSTFQRLTKNSQSLQADKIQILNQNALDFLTNKSLKKFDFVFLDPPFNQNLLPKTLTLLTQNNFIATNGKIYLESEFKIQPEEAARWSAKKIQIIKQKQSGQVHYCLIKVL